MPIIAVSTKFVMANQLLNESFLLLCLGFFSLDTVVFGIFLQLQIEELGCNYFTASNPQQVTAILEHRFHRHGGMVVRLEPGKQIING